jgi:hypothetical protein
MAIGCVGFFLNCISYGPWALSSAIRETAGDLTHFGDFTQFYIGACLAGTDLQYDRDHVQRMQRAVTGVIQPHLMPSRLPFYYGLLRPLCSLSYLSAHRVWLVFITLAAVSAIILLSFTQGKAVVVASLWSLPLFISTMTGQDVGLVYLVLAGGLWLRKSGRPWSAGLVLSLLWIKFHLFLLLPILFVIKREFRLLAGALFGSAALLAACFALAGKQWPAKYAGLLLDPVLSPGPEVMPNLQGAASRFPDSAVIETLLTILVIAITILVIARSRFAISFAAALLGSLLISRHAYVADCAVLIPGLVAIRDDRDSSAREIALICLLPFPYWLAETLHYGWILAILFLVTLVALMRRTLIRAAAKVAATETALP